MMMMMQSSTGSSSSRNAVSLLREGVGMGIKRRSISISICVGCRKIGIFGTRNPNANGPTAAAAAAAASSSSSFKKIASSSSSSNWDPHHRHRHDSHRATAENAEGGGGDASPPLLLSSSSPSSSLISVVQLGSLFALWYLFNIYFNIYNKQVLEVYPFPLTISSFQFAVGTLLVFLMSVTNIYRIPSISSSRLLAIVPLAVVHTLGTLFTNMSLGKVAVSFTHTVKALEPFFSVLLSALFLGQVPPIWVLSSLVPIVGGVALASLAEVSFNWAGFWSAMASNLANQSRNVLSKKIMVKKEESLDNITLFSIITVMSFFLSVPVAMFVEGIKFAPSHIQSVGLNLREIYTRSLLAALCFHAYQQAGYMILARVSPVSHSVGNCVKRVVVIVSSVLFFRTPVSPINSLGTGVALAGVFLYSRINKIKAKAS